MNYETLIEKAAEITSNNPGISAQESQNILIAEFDATIPESEISILERQENRKRTEKAREGCSIALDALMSPSFEHPNFSDVDEIDMGTTFMQFRSISLDDDRTVNFERQLKASMDGEHYSDEKLKVTLLDEKSDSEINLNLMGWFTPPVDSTHGSLAWEEDLDSLVGICKEYGVPYDAPED